MVLFLPEFPWHQVLQCNLLLTTWRIFNQGRSSEQRKVKFRKFDDPNYPLQAPVLYSKLIPKVYPSSVSSKHIVRQGNGFFLSVMTSASASFYI